MADLGLRVNGREYRGWTSARVTRGIDAISGGFDLSVTERWAGQDEAWPIGEGDECSVVVGGEAIITGYIDTRNLSFDANDHTVGVAGRDRTGDLVDCSALLGRWSFTNVSIPAVVGQICAPYGISVAVQPGLVLGPTTVPKKFSIDPGDSAFDAIENLCKAAGILAISDGVGGLILTRTGNARCTTELVEGGNILSGTSRFSYADRYRDYLVMGSHKGRGDLSGRSASAVKGKASDATARAGRALVIRPDGNVTTAQATARAQWEAAVRAARGDEVSVRVQGWTQADGTVWPINSLVRIQAPRLQVDGTMLITRATYSLEAEGGTTTDLELRRPTAFAPDPNLGAPTGPGADRYWKEIVRGV